MLVSVETQRQHPATESGPGCPGPISTNYKGCAELERVARSVRTWGIVASLSGLLGSALPVELRDALVGQVSMLSAPSDVE